MPYLVRIDGDFERDVPELFPEQLHATACSLFDRDDESHRAGLKGFAVCDARTSGRRAELVLGLLEDAALDDLEHRLDLGRGELRLGRLTGVVETVHVLESPSWDDLADMATDIHLIDVEFVRPTFFRRGDAYNLLPSPATVFGHWRRRWQHFHGAAPRITLEDKAIHVVDLNVRTVRTSYRREPVRAFTGRVSYDVSGLPASDRAALHALALLAPFAGCGSRTTAGFGACRSTFHP